MDLAVQDSFMKKPRNVQARQPSFDMDETKPAIWSAIYGGEPYLNTFAVQFWILREWFPGSKKWVACGPLLFEVRKSVTTIMVMVKRLTSVGARRTAGAVFVS